MTDSGVDLLGLDGPTIAHSIQATAIDLLRQIRCPEPLLERVAKDCSHRLVQSEILLHRGRAINFTHKAE